MISVVDTANDISLNIKVILSDFLSKMIHSIQYENRSRSWLYKQLALLCAKGKLCKFDKGVYYLPEMNRLGFNKILSSYAVAEKKYIGEEENTIGYYSEFS